MPPDPLPVHLRLSLPLEPDGPRRLVHLQGLREQDPRCPAQLPDFPNDPLYGGLPQQRRRMAEKPGQAASQKAQPMRNLLMQKVKLLKMKDERLPPLQHLRPKLPDNL